MNSDRTWPREWAALRLATALVHSLPDLGLELESRASRHGGVATVRIDDAACCRFRSDLGHALTTGTVPELIAGMGLDPSRLAVRLDEAEVADHCVGAGAYRWADDGMWGFVTATVLSPAKVDATLAEATWTIAPPLDLCQHVDDHIGVVLLHSRHDDGPMPAHEMDRLTHRFVDIVGAIAVAELLDDCHRSGSSPER